jgi:hypothetical protein
MVGKCGSDGDSEIWFDFSIQEMDLLVDGASGCMENLVNKLEMLLADFVWQLQS